jgi:hypothetical protein
VSERIPVRAFDGTVRAYVLVDEADAEWAKRFAWRLSGARYAQRHVGDQRWALMHRELLGLARGDGLCGDHISGDRLDNRRGNLRVVTRAENQQNQKSEQGSSRFRGVSAARGRWRAGCRVGGRQLWAGSFDTEEEAAAAADALRRRHMPSAVPGRLT